MIICIGIGLTMLLLEYVVIYREEKEREKNILHVPVENTKGYKNVQYNRMMHK